SIPSRALTMGIIFVSQTGAGILGNTFLFSYYVFICCSGQRIRNTDWILMNLIFVNCLVLLSRGIPQAMQAFGMKYFLDDFGYKLVFYLNRVSRGVSLGTTSLLSGFQTIIISPSSPSQKKLKVKAPKYIGFSIILCWILHMLVNISALMYITGKTWNRESKNLTENHDLGYCYGLITDSVTSLLHIVIYSFTDVLCLGFTVWASASMVLILYRHKQNVLHIHSKNFSPKYSAETKATHSILTLMSTFFSSYSLSSFFTFYMIYFDKPSGLLVDTTGTIAVCFPPLRPFVLISGDPCVSRLCFACCARA
uniref:Vomeronasal type-1 receptor n=1 Tax=Loxodonta africana TaxID=9785 RepID=G3U045_LOXAF